MKYLKLIGATFFSCWAFLCNGQKQDVNWCFGDSCGLNFNGAVTPFTTGINSIEASASISDNNGNLLFYAGSNDDGTPSSFFRIAVWDSSHNIMQNGDSLEGSETITQGCLIIPFINDTNKYYLFTISCPQSNPFEHKLHYSIIDKSLNGGLGAVTQKNILVCDSLLTEQMRAVKHGNGRDWWIITHKYGNSDFYKFLLTPSGISGPLIQSIGLPVDTGTSNLGQMDLSLSGDKLVFACSSGPFELFDFDRCNGNIFNHVSLGEYPNIQNYSYYGCAFSPDGNLLYASRADTLFQFNLNSPNIITSRLQIYLAPHPGTILFYIDQLQLAPDSNIYVALTTPYSDSLNAFLSVINNPNSLGMACNFVPFSVPLSITGSSGSSRLLTGLPNMPNYNLGRLEGSTCDTLTSISSITLPINLKVSPNPNDGNFIIKYELPQNKSGMMEIYDVMGKSVYRQTLPQWSTMQRINLKTLTAGIYVVKVYSDGSFAGAVRVVKE